MSVASMIFFILAFKFVGTFKQAPQAVYVNNSYTKMKNYSKIIDDLFMRLPKTIEKNKVIMKRKVALANLGFAFVIVEVILIVFLVSLLIHCFI